MTHVIAARESAKVKRNRQDADRITERWRRAAEHYATEGFQVEAQHGCVVPYLDPDSPDFPERARMIGDPSRMQELEALASQLPATFGSRMLRVSDRRVGVVGSQETADLLEGTADVRRLDPATPNAELEALDLLIVALPVVGREPPLTPGEITTLSRRVLPAARGAGIPTVAIALSDPWRSNATHAIAPHVEWLLTTDPNGPAAYSKHMGNPGRVLVIDGHFNPLRHSPVGRNRHREGGALFSGRLPSTVQPGRLKALRHVLNGLRRAETPLTLASSAVLEGVREQARGVFPLEYLGDLTHDPNPVLRPRVMRLFDLHVLAHLQPGSGHAHPQETLEALASGGSCMSTYSVAMNNDFPHVLLPDGPQDAALEAALLQADAPHRRELQMEGVRRAFARQTADQLMAEVLRETGVDDVPRHRLVVWRATPDDSDRGLFTTQVVAPDIDLRRITPDDPVPDGAIIEIKIGQRVSGRHHLVQDVVNAFRMASVRTVRMDAGLPLEAAFEISSDGNHQDAAVTATWTGGGLPEHAGVFTMDATALRPDGPSALPPQARELSVIVPVFNNGTYLLRKCMESLRRSTAFPAMDVILVDDGSTAPETRAIVRELGARWDNVRTHLFPVGGSGSASRPRNKGLEMVKTPWVTYLDPDNEAVGDGYAHLLDLCRKRGVDFAIGDMLRYAKTRTLTTNVGILRNVIDPDPNGVGAVPADALPRISFQPMSIQALVADTQWLRSLGLEQPVGALGQDSLFFQQMLQGAREIALLDEPIHTYYGEVAGSMVNSVSPTFFRKYLPLEAARSQWLREHDLFEDYVRLRMRRYVTVWFLPKFNSAVAADEKAEAFEVLKTLCGTYGLDVRLKKDGTTAELAQ